MAGGDRSSGARAEQQMLAEGEGEEKGKERATLGMAMIYSREEAGPARAVQSSS